MSNVAIAKPLTITGAVITGGKLGTGGTDFFIKCMSFRPSFNVPVVETTGDGDSAPSFDTDALLYLSGQIDGLMVAQSVSTFLLANFIDSSKNPLAASMKFGFATQQILTVPKALITGCAMSWNRNGTVIRILMPFRATDSHPTWGTT